MDFVQLFHPPKLEIQLISLLQQHWSTVALNPFHFLSDELIKYFGHKLEIMTTKLMTLISTKNDSRAWGKRVQASEFHAEWLIILPFGAANEACISCFYFHLLKLEFLVRNWKCVSKLFKNVDISLDFSINSCYS